MESSVGNLICSKVLVVAVPGDLYISQEGKSMVAAQERVLPGDLPSHALNGILHSSLFSCASCGVHLSIGFVVFLRENVRKDDSSPNWIRQE